MIAHNERLHPPPSVRRRAFRLNRFKGFAPDYSAGALQTGQLRMPGKRDQFDDENLASA
jgi:hypothetical protein